MTIKLEYISKFYYSTNAVTQALRKVKLEFGVGEFVAITGESGSGKSTLLNIVSGMDTYDDGELYIEGEATSHYDSEDWEEYRKNRVGFVFQNYNLIENYSALNNVESSLMIQGYGNQEARRIAKELLKKVGLEKQAKQRASRLSSGQKQRLSIARALAKNTDIIVADEPTGNLDSENGRQIMELFGKLSKEKLVIVVTHNYEEAAPFVTRKIRLHDGEVVSDIPVNRAVTGDENQYSEGHVINTDNIASFVPGSDSKALNTESTIPASVSRAIKSDRRIAWSFTWMNITTQPGRVLLFMVFLLITTAVSLIFLGDIYSNWDDVFIKFYNSSAFLNSDITRIVVKKPDGSEITPEDISRFNSIKYVTMTDQYGFADDINYYMDEKVDYEYVYKSKDNLLATEKERSVDFLHMDKFIKSSTCISQEDLSVGRLPESRNEVVIYSKNPSELGKEKPCYFTNKNAWGSGQYYGRKVTVVGLLKKESTQVYFSEELCHMLSLDIYGDSYMMYMHWDFFKNQYLDSASFIPVIGEGLSSGQGKNGSIHEIRVSKELVLPGGHSPLGKAYLEVFRKEDGKYAAPDYTSDATVLDQYHDHSPSFIEIGEEEFYRLFTHQSRQASVYIKDYIYMDRVLKELRELGYDAISSYRVSVVEYDPKKVTERNVIIIKALIVLLVIGLLEIIIIRSVFNLKNRDFYILRSMGMNQSCLRWMNCIEMFIYVAFSVLVVFGFAKTAGIIRTGYLSNMVKYYNIRTFAIYAVLNLAVMALTLWSVDRSLKRKLNKVA